MLVSLHVRVVYAITVNGRNDIDTVIISSEALISRSQGEPDSLEGSSIPHRSVTDVGGVTAKLMPWIKYGSAYNIALFSLEELACGVCLTCR